MKNPKLSAIALFISFLIIMMPVAFAQQLNVQKYSGKDNVNGFISRDDVLIVEATTPSTISAQQMRIFFGDIYFLFDSCTTANSFSKCNYTKSMQGFYGSEEYKIRLYDTPSTTNAADEKIIKITTDVLAPKINNFLIEPLASKEGRVQIQYSASDFAFNPADENTCSGLKEIEITYGTQKIATDTTDGLCKKENSLTYEVTTASNYESKDICIQAKDKMGLISEKVCKKFSIDKKAPEIKNVDIFETNGQKITHVHTGEQKTANIVVTIDGNDDIDENSVTADLSRFNPTLGTKQNDGHTANHYVWNNVQITTPANCAITVSASDLLGNLATKTLNCVIGIDDTAPVPKSITTGHVDSSKELLGVNGKIIVEFEEAGVGMNQSNVFMDLSQIGMGGRVKAENCYKESNWKCEWNVAPSVSGVKTVSLLTDTQDDLGNKIASSIRQEVLIDREPPIILGTQKIKITHNSLELGNVTVAGDTVEFYLKANKFDFAFANFSDLSDAQKVEADLCQTQENFTICSFQTTIQNSGPYLANITFDFSDKAGNTASKKNNLFVYGISNDLSPNYWNISNIQCSPKIIDREIASLKPHPVYCALNLESKNKNAVPVLTSLKDPAACRGDTPELINNVELKNSGFNSKHPTLLITLEATNFEVNSYNISCPVEIYTKVGDLFTNAPEEETAKFSLSFYNLPFGELNKNVNEDIDDAVESAQDTLKWVGTLQKFVDYVGKLCQIKSIITSILSTLDVILITFGATAHVLKPIVPGEALAVDQVRQTLCGKAKGPLENFYTGHETIGGIFNFLEKACSFVDCRLTPEGAKWADAKIVNTAALIGGGGIPGTNWCSNIQNFLSLGTDSSFNLFGNMGTKDVNARLKGVGADAAQQDQLINVKDSLVWSTACFCVPGILYNLNKYRQIQCRYATCMISDMKEKGIPKSYCTDTAHYQTCTFIMGEIFSLLPIMAFLDKIYKALTDIFSNPFAAVATVAGCLCGGCAGLPGASSIGVIDWCKAPYGGLAYGACITVKTISKIGDAAASIGAMTEMADSSYWEVKNDWCESMEEAQDRREEAEDAAK